MHPSRASIALVAHFSTCDVSITYGAGPGFGCTSQDIVGYGQVVIVAALLSYYESVQPPRADLRQKTRSNKQRTVRIKVYIDFLASVVARQFHLGYAEFFGILLFVVSIPVS